jgi:hypothetical protein
MIRTVVLTLTFGITILFLALVTYAWTAERTPDEWFVLTMELEQAMPRINNEPDRQFIKHMINVLTVAQDVQPTPAQQHWLLSIKTELDRRKR